MTSLVMRDYYCSGKWIVVQARCRLCERDSPIFADHAFGAVPAKIKTVPGAPVTADGEKKRSSRRKNRLSFRPGYYRCLLVWSLTERWSP